MNAYAQASFFYGCNPEMLTSEVVDIPVVVQYSSSEMYAGFLLAVDERKNTAMVKIALGNFPRPPIVGFAEKIKEDNLVFEYATVNLAIVALMRNLGVSEQNEVYEHADIEADSFLAQQAAVSALHAEYAEFCNDRLEYCLGSKEISLSEDFRGADVTMLQPFKSKIIIKQIGEKIIAEELTAAKTIDAPTLANRKLLVNVKQKALREIVQRNLEYDSVRERLGLEMDILLCPAYVEQIKEWHYDYYGLFKGVMQAFLGGTNFSSNLSGFVWTEAELLASKFEQNLDNQGTEQVSVAELNFGEYNYIGKLVDKTLDNIDEIQQRFSNYTNTNQVHYAFLLFLLFLQEALPLSAMIEAVCLYLTLQPQIADAKQLVLSRIYNVIKELIISIYSSLAEPLLENIFEREEFLAYTYEYELTHAVPYFKIDVAAPILKEYIVKINVATIESSDCSELLTLQSEYNLAISLLNSVSFDYVYDFNYVTFQNNLAFKLYNLLATDESKAITELKIDASSVDVFFAAIIKYRRANIMDSRFDIEISEDVVSETVDRIKSVFSTFFNVVTEQQRTVSLLKMDKSLSELEQLVENKKIENVAKPVKSVKEFEHFSFLALDSTTNVINYDFFRQLCIDVAEMASQLNYIVNEKYYQGLINYDISEWIEQAQQDIADLEEYLTNEVIKVINQLSSHVEQEIRYVRTALYRCSVNPEYFRIAMELREFLRKDKLLWRVYTQLHDVFGGNGEVVLSCFPALMKDFKKYEKFIEVSYGNMLRPCVQWISLARELREEILDFDAVCDDILDIVNAVDGYVIEQTGIFEQELFVFMEFESYEQFEEQYKKMPAKQLSEFKYSGTAKEAVERVVLSSLAKATSISIISDEFTAEELRKEFQKHTVNELTLLREEQQQYDKAFAIETKVTSVDSYMCYIQAALFELASLSESALKWRVWLTKNKDFAEKADFMRVPKTVTPSSLILGFAPIIEFVHNFNYILSSLDSEVKIRKFPAELLLQEYEKLLQIVKMVNYRISLAPFYLTSNHVSYIKQGLITKDKDKIAAEGNLVLINYSNTIKMANSMLLTLEIQYQKIAFVYFIQDPLFEEKHFYSFAKLMRVPIDKQLDEDVQSLFEIYDKNNEIADYTLLLRQNVRIDYHAKSMLDRLENMLERIVVQNVFAVRLTDERRVRTVKLKVDQQTSIDVSELRMLMIAPIYWDSVCSEILDCCSKIINNIGFLGQKTANCETLYDENYELMYFEISEQLKNSYQNKEQHKLLREWRYNSAVENQARDIDAITQVLRLVLEELKNLPIMLYDLLTVYNNNELIMYSEASVETRFNLFSVEQEQKLLEFLVQWNTMVNNYIMIDKKVSIIELVYDDEFCEHITVLYTKVQAFYDQFIQNPSRDALLLLHNEVKDGKLQALTIDEQFLGSSVVIPHTIIEGHLHVFFKSLLLNLPINQLFSEFSIEKLESIRMPALYPQFKQLLFSEDKQSMVGMLVGDERAVFSQKVPFPRYVYQFVDACDQALQESIVDKAISCFDCICILMRQKKQEGGEPCVSDSYPKSALPAITIQSVIESYDESILKLALSTYFYSKIAYLVMLLKSRQNRSQIAAMMMQIDYLLQEIPSTLAATTQFLQQYRQLLLSLEHAKDFFSWKSKNYGNFVVDIIDMDQKKIVLTDLDRKYNILRGSIEYSLKNSVFNVEAHHYLDSVMIGIHERIPVLFVGFENDFLHESLMGDVENLLKTTLRRRMIRIYVSNDDFLQKLRLIEQSVICGMIIFVFNYENLANENMQMINSLIQKLKLGKGSCFFHYISQREESTTSTVSREQKEFRVRALDYSEVETLGRILFYIPGLACVQDNETIYYLDDEGSGSANEPYKELSGNQTLINGYTFCQENNVEQIINNFDEVQVVLLDSEDIIKIYENYSRIYGLAFFEVSQALKQLSDEFYKLEQQDVQCVIDSIIDVNDIASITCVLCDYVLRESHFIIGTTDDKARCCRQIGYIIASAFGLADQQTVKLMAMCKQFSTYTRYSMQANAGAGVNANIKGKQFLQYYEYFKDYLDQTMVENIDMYARLHELSALCSYDLYFVGQLLKKNNPVLLLSYSHTYLKKFLIYLAVIEKADVVYIYDSAALTQQLEELVFNTDAARLLYLIPSELDEIEVLNSILSQYMLQYKLAVKVVLCLSVDKFRQVTAHQSLTLFKHKLVLFPFVENSLGDKFLFLQQLNINKYYYSRLAEFKLYHLWSESVGNTSSFKNISNFFNISRTVMNKDRMSIYYRIENRLMVLESFIYGVYSYSYDVIASEFGVSIDYEGQIIIRNLVLLFLYKHNILTILKRGIDNHYFEQYEDSHKECSFEIMQQILNLDNPSLGNDELQRFIIRELADAEKQPIERGNEKADESAFQRRFLCQNMQPINELGGYNEEKLNYYEQQFDKLYQINKNYEKSTESVLSQYLTNHNSYYGQALDGSLKFVFDEDFLLKYYVQPLKNIEAFSNILSLLLAAIWNSVSLYFMHTSMNEKQRVSDNQSSKQIAEIYNNAFEELTNAENTNIMITTVLIPVCAMLAFDESEKHPQLNMELFKNLVTTNNFPIHKVQTGLNQAEQAEVMIDLLEKTRQKMPQDISTATEYIEIVLQENTLSYCFRPYEIGSGILSGLTQLSEQQIIETSIFELAKQSDLQKRKISDESQPTSISDSVISIETLADTAVYIDQMRSSFVVFLGGCLLSAITFSLIGPANTGKTLLLSIAKLFVRELIDSAYVCVDQKEEATSARSQYILQSILQKYIIRNYAICSKNRYYSKQERKHADLNTMPQKLKVLDYYQSMSFPCFHISFSAKETYAPDDALELLLRDHLVHFTHGVFVDNGEERISGVGSLSDCSLAIESRTAKLSNEFSSITLREPTISEEFMVQLLCRHYTQHEECYIRRFVSGFFMLKSAFQFDFLHNFQIVQTLFRLSQRYSLDGAKMPEEQTVAQTGQCSALETLYYENFSATDVLCNEDDRELANLNIFSLFNAIAQHLPQQDVLQIQERLSSLDILGYLDDEYTNGKAMLNPWANFSLLIDLQFSILPCWEAQIYNLTLNHQFVQNVYKQYDFIFESPLIISCDNSPIEYFYRLLSQELMINCGFYHISKKYFEFAIIQYQSLLARGAQPNPILYVQIIKIILRLLVAKQRNTNFMSSYLQYGIEITNKNSLSGILSECQNTNERQAIYNNAARFSTLIMYGAESQIDQLTEEQQELYKQERELYEMQIQYLEEEQDSSTFGGLPLSSAFQLTVFFEEINILNFSLTEHNDVVQFIATMTNSLFFKQNNPVFRFPLSQADSANHNNSGSSRASSQASGISSSSSSMSSALTKTSIEEKIEQRYFADQEERVFSTYVFDLMTMCNDLLVYRPNPKDATSGFSIIDYVHKTIQNYKKANVYNDEQLDAIEVILILRIILCLAVGIRPDIIVDSEYNPDIPELTDGIRINSKLATVFPSKLVPNGRFMASLPIKCSNWAQMTEKYREKKRKFHHAKTRVLDSMIMMPIQCILLLDSEHMNLTLNNETAIHHLLKRMLQPTNLLATLFTMEEIEAISILVSYNFQVESIIDCKMISQFIATNLQIVEFNNDPFISNEVSGSNIVNFPIMQFDPQTQQTYTREQVETHFEERLYNAKLVGIVLEKTNKLKHRAFAYSVINARFATFENLYAISQCSYPREYVFHRMRFDNTTHMKNLMYSSLVLYRELSKYAKTPVITYRIFTRICVTLFHMIMDKIQALDLAYYKLSNFHRLYDMISAPAGQNYRKLNVQDISMAYFEDIINKMLAKIYQQSKEDGIELTKPQQQLQAAVAEAVMLRDTFQTALANIGEELDNEQKMTRCLALDVSCLAALMAFGVNDELDTAMMNSMINSGNYGDINAHLLKIGKSLGGHYHHFNYCLIVILTFYGYSIRHIEETYEQSMLVEKTAPEQLVLACNAFSGGKYMLVNNIVQVLNPDWPILPIVEFGSFLWKVGDPYYSYLELALLYFLVGFSTIFIDNELAECVGLAITSQHHHIASLNVVNQMVSSVELDSSYKQLIHSLQQTVQVIDLTQLFGTILQKIRAAINAGHVIVFINMGSKFANSKAIMMLRKLLLMKCSATTRVLKTFSLGPIVCTSQLELEYIPIVIGYNEACDCIDLLRDYDMYTECTINYCAILKMTHQNHAKQRSRQFCDSLVTRVFGYTYNQRYYYEEIRVSKAQTIVNIGQINQLITSYFKQYIVPHLLKSTLDFDKETFSIGAALRQEQAVELCSTFSSFASNNKKQQVMMDIVIKSIKNYSRERSAVAVVRNANYLLDEVNFEFELRCLARSYLKQYVIPGLEKICESLDIYLETMYQLSILHIPLLSLQGQNLEQLILDTIKWDIEELTKNVVNSLKSCPRELTPDELKKYGVKLFIDEYPLLYYAKTHDREINICVLKSIFSSIAKYLSITLPVELLPAMWLYSFTLLFSYNSLLSDDPLDKTSGVEAVTQLLTDNFGDITRIITSEQLYLSFEGSNIFSINKMFSQNYIQTRLSKIDNINQVIPDLCKMSSKLEYSWIELQAGAKYNMLLRNTMQYFLKNTAIFVNLAKAHSPLLTLLRGYAEKYPQWVDTTFSKSDEHRWLFDKLFKGAYNGEIQEPPQGFSLDSLPSYFASFLISLLLQPGIIMQDIEAFAALVSEYTGSTFSQLIANNTANPTLKVHGSSQFGYSTVADKVIARFSEYIAHFCEEFALPKPQNSTHLIDPSFYMLCSLAGTVVQSYNTGRDAVAIVYVDCYFDVQTTLQCVGEFITALFQIPFVITNEAVESNVLQFSIIESLQLEQEASRFLEIKHRITAEHKEHPWIVICPANLISDDPFQSQSSHMTAQEISQFIGALTRLQENETPIFCYVEKPKNPYQAFLHIFNIAVLMFARYSGKNVQEHLFHHNAFLEYALYHSLQFQNIKTNRIFYDMFRTLADQCYSYSELNFDLQEDAPEMAQFELSAIQMNFDETLCQIIRDKKNLSDVMLQRLYMSEEKQRSIQLLAESSNENSENEECEDENDSEGTSNGTTASRASESLNNSFDSSPIDSSPITSSQQTETSDNSSSVFDPNQKKRKKTVYKAHNVYNEFLLQLRQFKNEALLANLSIDDFSKSVLHTISSTERNLCIQPLDQQYIVSHNVDNMEQILSGLLSISSMMSLSNEDPMQRALACRLFKQPIPELAVRRMLAKRELKAYSQQSKYGIVQATEANQPQLLRTLPTDLAAYYRALSKENIMYFTSRAADFEVFNGFSPTFHCDIPVVESAFTELDNCWEFDGEAIVHVLGDLLHYLRMIFAIKHSIPLELVKIAGFLQHPDKEPFIDEENKFRFTNDQFIVCKVNRLRIFNGFFDTVKQELVNLSDIEASGFSEDVPIYFVALSSSATCENTGSANEIPHGYIALTVKCGGLVKPLVYALNKSQIRPEEYNKAGMFIGVGVL